MCLGESRKRGLQPAQNYTTFKLGSKGIGFGQIVSLRDYKKAGVSSPIQPRPEFQIQIF